MDQNNEFKTFIEGVVGSLNAIPAMVRPMVIEILMTTLHNELPKARDAQNKAIKDMLGTSSFGSDITDLMKNLN